MADIDVQRRPPTTWIWVLLGLVVLALLLFWLLASTDPDRVAVVDPALEPMPPAAPVEPVPLPPVAPVAPVASVQQYQEECAPRQPETMALDHQYTATCIRTLAMALQDVLPQERRAAVEAELASARDAAQQLAVSPPDVVNHSQLARDGFTSLANAFTQVEQQWYPGLAAQQLRQTAESIDPAETLLEQRREVEQFFTRAGTALDRIAGTT
jgi:hypothetical protein